MGRSPCCAKEGLNRGAWTAMEDKILTDYIKIHGEGSWRGLPKRAGLKRCGKSCRLRWLNYLRPDIKRGNITGDEEELIIRLHKLLGNRWSLIAGRLPGRTDNEIKNYWNTNLSKKVHNASRQKAFEENKVVRRSSIATPTKDSLDPVSNVAIRTKAFKCRRVFIRPPPQPASLPPPMAPPPPTVALASPQMKDPLVKIDTNSDPNNLISSKGVPEGPLIDFTSSDLSMIGELNFSDFLDSQQMLDVFCDLSQGTSNEGDQFSPSTSLEEPIVFPEDMMEDWRSSLDFASKIEFWLGDQ